MEVGMNSLTTTAAIPAKRASLPRLVSHSRLGTLPRLLPLTSTFKPLLPTLIATPRYPHAVAAATSSSRSYSRSQGRTNDNASSSSASSAEVDMVQRSDGVWSAKQAQEQKVVVLWDLDNKPPHGPPYEAAMALRHLASLFGRIVDISAYANHHAFIHLPQWVLEQRSERRRLDVFERKGIAMPSEPYVCGVCGRKCRTNLDLKKHFKQLHERERQKKLSRMRSLKGKKRRRYKERFVSGNHKYEEAARELLMPRIGYGLATELRRAGVFVKTVEDKPQAADSALKRQMQHSMTRGIDWLFLVSDDSDFSDMIRRARESDLRTVVVGDGRTALSRHADLWVPWVGVQNGEVGEEILSSDRREGGPEEYASFSPSHFYQTSNRSDLDDMVDEIVVGNSGFSRIAVSGFSEEEAMELDSAREGLDDDDYRIYGSSVPSLEAFLWDSEEEEEDSDDDGDGYF